MADSWATYGVDLHLERDRTHVRAGLESALRAAVQTGRLGPGVRLPSSRALATDLGIARNTVADVYGQLIAEGWLIARHGSGTWVAEQARAPARRADATDSPRQPRFDLRPGFPDSSAFPRAAWLSAARRALQHAPDDAFGYSDPRGLPELRGALAEYLARARGVWADPESIVISAGFTQGLGVLCRALRARGMRTIGFETYGIQEHRGLAQGSGLVTVSLPIDAAGAQPAALKDVHAVLLTPAHQFPLGATLAPDRRSEVVRWARRTGAVVIEDDYDGEFRYDRQPVGAMQSLAPDRVIYAGTASKSLAPGVRLGWLVLPAWLVDGVAAQQALEVRSVSAIDQLTLAELIRSGAYDRQVRRARLSYRRRRDQLIRSVAQSAPDARFIGISAGLHAVLVPPPGRSDAELIAGAAERHLALEGLAAYTATDAPPRSGLVIGYAKPPQHAYIGAIARLAATLAPGDGRGCHH